MEPPIVEKTIALLQAEIEALKAERAASDMARVIDMADQRIAMGKLWESIKILDEILKRRDK